MMRRRSGDSLNRLLRFLDADKDGTITPADSKVAFTKSDKNGDEAMSVPEVT